MCAGVCCHLCRMVNTSVCGHVQQSLQRHVYSHLYGHLDQHVPRNVYKHVYKHVSHTLAASHVDTHRYVGLLVGDCHDRHFAYWTTWLVLLKTFLEGIVSGLSLWSASAAAAAAAAAAVQGLSTAAANRAWVHAMPICVSIKISTHISTHRLAINLWVMTIHMFQTLVGTHVHPRACAQVCGQLLRQAIGLGCLGSRSLGWGALEAGHGARCLGGRPWARVLGGRPWG